MKGDVKCMKNQNQHYCYLCFKCNLITCVMETLWSNIKYLMCIKDCSNSSASWILDFCLVSQPRSGFPPYCHRVTDSSRCAGKHGHCRLFHSPLTQLYRQTFVCRYGCASRLTFVCLFVFYLIAFCCCFFLTVSGLCKTLEIPNGEVSPECMATDAPRQPSIHWDQVGNH